MDVSTFHMTVNSNDTNDYSIETSVCVTFGCLGVLDNGFVIILMMKANLIKKKICNMLAFHQSLVDFIASFLVFCKAPTLTGFQHLHGSPKGVTSELYCLLWESDYFFWVAMIASTYNIVAITVDRYLEVVYPLRYTAWCTLKRAKWVLAAVWLIGFTLPVVVIMKPIQEWKEESACSQKDYNISFSPLVVASCTITFTFLLPVTVMLVCYIHMIITIRSKVRIKVNNSSSIMTAAERRRYDRSQRMQRGLRRTVFMVSICYVICWMGDQVYFFLRINGNLSTQQDLKIFFKSLVYLNCCINPLIYICQYHEFQMAVKKSFGICKKSDDSIVLGRSNQTTFTIQD